MSASRRTGRAKVLRRLDGLSRSRRCDCRLFEAAFDGWTPANALAALGGVLELDSRYEQAAAAVQEAFALYERKGNVVMAERARAQLSRLQKQVM